MDLLEWQRKQQQEKTAPLAARMRPRALDDFVGQDAIIGPGRLLRRAIQADQLSSLLLYGPPGTGKTTLARIIANTTRAHFISKNAVLSGVKDIRAAIADAQMRRDSSGSRTILFIDEVHRFNKSQQDALLPWVENGTVILIGATTENPYFEVNKALVSRSRVFQLKSLEAKDLRKVITRTLEDQERGYGDLAIELADEAAEHLVNVANGDARALLNALELAVETTLPDETGVRSISLDTAEESIQRRAVLYDKEGDTHFDTISAFIKSLRGSDPDAALYWLARMVYAGEDPRYIFRRLLIFASEDVGLADPQAIAVTSACATTFDRVGMPEGKFHLAQATLYLANADKSNSTMGFFDALSAVQKEQEEEIPNHLKDPSRDKKGFGHGAGYLYPHAYREHWVAQQYLPKSLQGKLFYQPSTQGWEGQIQLRVTRHREAQLAVMLEGDGTPTEVLTSSPQDRTTERWLQRTIGQAGTHLAALREQLFQSVQPERHHVLLDLHARSGFLTWEALRQVPEGGVYSCVQSSNDAQALQEQSQALPELQRPQLLTCSLPALIETLQEREPTLLFDKIIGRNVLRFIEDKQLFFERLVTLLREEGSITLLETVPQSTQRIYALLQPSWLSDGLYKKLQEAEELLYIQKNDDPSHWTLKTLQQDCQKGQIELSSQTFPQVTEVCLTPTLFERWFRTSHDKSSYRNQLDSSFSARELDQIYRAFQQHLSNQVVNWSSMNALLAIRSFS